MSRFIKIGATVRLLGVSIQILQRWTGTLLPLKKPEGIQDIMTLTNCWVKTTLILSQL